jgi:phosphate-selective porin
LLPPDPGSTDDGGTVVIGRAELEQILARLGAAEEQIGALQQQAGAPAEVAEVPVEEPVDPCAPAEEDEPIAADSAKYLIPLSTDCGDITFKPGVRIQPRYTYDDGNDNHDFFIRRFRLKAGGDIFDCAWYGMELKIDSAEKFGAQKRPDAVVENAWLDVTVWPESTFLRLGLYDAPISRNALTSDSKLLLMDRSLIKEYLTGFGFTDNTVGMMFHGRPHGGRYEWMVGLFDNIEYEFHSDDVDRESDKLMPAGRVVWNVFDPAEPPQGYADYWESYLGEGHRLAFGLNGGQLSEAIDNGDIFDITVWGADVFWNRGPWVATAEYDWITFNGDDNDFIGDGWFVQGGYFFYDNCWELAARYQILDPSHEVFGDQQRWTTIGLNRYYWKHNLKIQMEYTFRDEQEDEEDNDLVQVQLQLDY